jgi:hypothetical protein
MALLAYIGRLYFRDFVIYYIAKSKKGGYKDEQAKYRQGLAF